ncbi:hypothetical protein [Teredinibacter sp. KSP-S5-2]|uniref:hypothetical protein n=1 Tax=Teredinibacter sp. KSP-S5-2 TaxID=3034506 RepID=UPI002934F44C|nr:hypothetical protein [Teredinibacter sp. KSP-S5-2]WNO10069.1 hypothetical protein P5V12_02675 [Teredinibacter sp. KSP-S5-2]
MRIYGTKNNVYDAVDTVLEHGIAAVEGTKIPAVEYANRIIECLGIYPDVSPIISYQNVPNAGYLYYVFDINRFPIGEKALEDIVLEIDLENA